MQMCLWLCECVHLWGVGLINTSRQHSSALLPECPLKSVMLPSTQAALSNPTPSADRLGLTLSHIVYVVFLSHCALCEVADRNGLMIFQMRAKKKTLRTTRNIS